MKISLLIADLGAGGAQKILTSLAAYWAEKGHDVSVITLCDGQNKFFQLSPSVKHISLDLQNSTNNPLTANFKRISKIRYTLKTLKAEQVISFIGSTNILAILAAIGLKTKLIISERNDPSRQSFGLFWDSLRKLLYRFANVVTANSDIAIAAMRTYVPENKLVMIPNQLTPPEAHFIKSMKDKDNIILAVGRLYPQKGFDTLLRAYALLETDWTLTIVGQGPLEDELNTLAQSLNIADRVTFTGQVENPYDYYARAKIFALPSRHEGTPNALLEAMSCGVCPIISDAAEGALPYVKNAAQIFACDNAEDLATKLTHIMYNPEHLQNGAEQATNAVHSLRPEAILPQWDEVL